MPHGEKVGGVLRVHGLWLACQPAVRIEAQAQFDRGVLRRFAATQHIPLRLHARPDDLRQDRKLTGGQLLVATLRGTEHGALRQGLGLLVERHRRPGCTLVRHLVEQGGDFLGVELLLCLGLLAPFLLLLLLLELGLLAPLLLLLLLELGLLALLFLLPPLFFRLLGLLLEFLLFLFELLLFFFDLALLFLERLLLFGLARLFFQHFLELLLLLKGGNRRRRCRFGRKGGKLLNGILGWLGLHRLGFGRLRFGRLGLGRLGLGRLGRRRWLGLGRLGLRFLFGRLGGRRWWRAGDRGWLRRLLLGHVR